MGDRAQVKFITEEKDIYFYTHWDASRLEDTVVNALKRGTGRHDDPEYLARIIFCEMVKDSILETTGYGIGFDQHGDVNRVIIVDCDNQDVTFFNGTVKVFSEFITEES